VNDGSIVGGKSCGGTELIGRRFCAKEGSEKEGQKEDQAHGEGSKFIWGGMSTAERRFGARLKVGEIIVAANGAHLVAWTRMRRASARPAEDSGPYLLTRI